MVDIYRDAKRRAIYPPLFTDPEGSKKTLLQFLLLKTFAKRRAISVSLRSQNSLASATSLNLLHGTSSDEQRTPQ